MTKALRIFYRESDNGIVWTSALEGTGVYPRTEQQETAALPDVVADGVALGGVPADYGCIEITDPAVIEAFYASDENYIVALKGKIN